MQTAKFVIRFVQYDKSIGIVMGGSHTAGDVFWSPKTLIRSSGFRKNVGLRHQNLKYLDRKIHALQLGFMCENYTV